MSNIQEELLNAIQIIAQNETSKLKLPKTVSTIVYAIADQSLGKYLVKEKDVIYTAYSNSVDIVYRVGESVYVLVPNSDYNETKMILGSTSELGADFVNIIEDRDKVNLIGVNCFTTDETFGLTSSTRAQELENYIDITPYIDMASFELYIQQSIGIMISMDVRTALDSRNTFRGNYGLKLTCKFFDSNNQDVYRTYYLDTPKMVGSPLRLTTKTNQYVLYNMDVARFQSVEECILFATGFSYDGTEPDIFIGNIALNFAEALTEEELSSYALNLRTVKGTIFSDNSDSELPMLAELKIRGITTQLTPSNSEFYWFIEDASIDFDSLYYSSYGDRGWRCLNDRLGTGTQSFFVSGDQQYMVKRSQVPISQSTFRGVVVYGGIVVRQTRTFQNLSALYSIKISSSAGTSFYFDAGLTDLLCEVLDRNGNAVNNNFTYVWGRYSSTGIYIEKIDTGNNKYTLDVNLIETFNTIRCSVFNQDGTLFGTGSIVLTNSIEKEAGYTLVINDSKRLFYYDENGDAPNDPIPQLTLSAFDPNGNEINLKVESHQVKWTIPEGNTLLTFDSDIQNYLRADTLTYGIAPRFDKSMVNNNVIAVEMKIRDITLIGETSFIFTKEGDIGTNGTSYYCEIVPNIDTYDFIDSSGETITKKVNNIYFVRANTGWNVVLVSTPDVNNNNVQYRSDLIPYNSLFNYYRVNLYKEGILLTGGITTSWYVGLASGSIGYYSNANPLRNMITVDGSGLYSKVLFKSTIDKTLTENIIKVQVTETSSTKIFYGAITVPIVIDTAESNLNNLLLPENNGFGFNEVVYGADGTTPKYDTDELFAVQNKNVTWEMEPNNFSVMQSSQRNIKVKPIEKFVSEVTNNYIRGYISDSSYIIYPVIMHLNTSGLGMLNDWDGVKYGIDNDSTYILAPQVGAGVKDNNNMFTGILMGDIRNSTTYSTTNSTKTVGMFGYTTGAQMFSLTPYNSVMTLGLPGYGQIRFDGINSTIMSGRYYSSSTGMKIDLYNGQIFINSLTGISDSTRAGAYMGADGLRIGNPTSYLLFNQASATLTVKGDLRADIGYIGGSSGWTIKAGSFYSGKTSLDSTTTGAYFGTDGINIGTSTKYLKYTLSAGTLAVKGTITADEGYIGGTSGWTITSGAMYTGSKSSLNAVATGAYLGADGLNVGSSSKYLKFTTSTGNLEIKGTVYADTGYIGGDTGWIIESGVIRSYNNRIRLTPSAITCGNFYVDSSGFMRCEDGEFNGTIYTDSGEIGGFTINSSGLRYGGRNVLYTVGSATWLGEDVYLSNRGGYPWTVYNLIAEVVSLRTAIDNIDTGGD